MFEDKTVQLLTLTKEEYNEFERDADKAYIIWVMEEKDGLLAYNSLQVMLPQIDDVPIHMVIPPLVFAILKNSNALLLAMEEVCAKINNENNKNV